VRRRTRRIAAVLLAAAAIVAAAATPAACGGHVESPNDTIDLARDQAARSQIMLVKTGIAAYETMNGAAPPVADKATLGAFVQPWPANPWTKTPMAPGKTKGDIAYAPGAGTAYTLGVVLSDGTVYTAP
jgi:hypothetical protein